MQACPWQGEVMARGWLGYGRFCIFS